ncbi:DUF2939 domain-containing protein [Luteimonas pelagia]
MKKLAALLLVVVVALAGWIAAGPFLTVNAIRDAVEAKDAAALSREVDFPAVRASLKAQLNDHMVRKAGPRMQSGLFGAFALRVGGMAVDAAVDAMVTPMGLAAVMEGRKVWDTVDEGVAGPDVAPRTGAPAAPRERALRDPEYRIESPSRVTATVLDEDGRPLTFVLTRQGLDWRLTDIRLPLGDAPAP